MTTEDLMKLRELAEAAQIDAGEWKWDGHTVDEDGYVYIPECSYLVGNICLSDQYEGYQNHCDFIAAANPAKVIELLDALEALGREVAELKQKMFDESEAMVVSIVQVKYPQALAARDQARAELAAIRATDKDAWMVADIDSAAIKLSECMDYPWEHMPEKGRENMRNHAQAVIDAASPKIGGV